MNNWQTILVILYGFLSFFGFLFALKECIKKKNSYGLCQLFGIFGAFVWGDLVVLGIFWTIISFAILILQDWILFLLIISIFWVIRSFGEVEYWLHEQFAGIERNPPEKFFIHKIFKNDSVWFVFQLYWQCIMVVSIIASLYFGKLWIQ